MTAGSPELQLLPLYHNPDAHFLSP